MDFDVAVVTSTYPRSGSDPTGRFLAELVEAVPLRFLLVSPRDPALGPGDGAAPARLGFANHGVFYGAGALANLRSGRLRPAAVARTLAAMLGATLGAAARSRVVWSHWAVPAGLFGALARLLLGARHVLLLHSGDVWLLEQVPGGRWLARFIAWQTDELLAVSEPLAERFARLTGRRGRVLGCGVAFPLRSTRRPGPPRVGTLSRLVPSKGVSSLAARSRALRGELHVAGDGPEAGSVARRLAGAGARYRGALVGAAKREFLSSLDVFAAPYGPGAFGQPEGLPVAVLEAMAAGCAVAAFRSAVPEGLIEDGVSGVLVPDGDFDALVAALNRLLDDPLRCRRLGRAARDRVEPWRLEGVARRWRDLLARQIELGRVPVLRRV